MKELLTVREKMCAVMEKVLPIMEVRVTAMEGVITVKEEVNVAMEEGPEIEAGHAIFLPSTKGCSMSSSSKSQQWKQESQ